MRQLHSWAFARKGLVGCSSNRAISREPRTLAVWGVLASLFEGVCAFAYLNNRAFAHSEQWFQ
jgi:hypothetical protein